MRRHRRSRACSPELARWIAAFSLRRLNSRVRSWSRAPETLKPGAGRREESVSREKRPRALARIGQAVAQGLDAAVVLGPQLRGFVQLDGFSGFGHPSPPSSASPGEESKVEGGPNSGKGGGVIQGFAQQGHTGSRKGSSTEAMLPVLPQGYELIRCTNRYSVEVSMSPLSSAYHLRFATRRWSSSPPSSEEPTSRNPAVSIASR